MTFYELINFEPETIHKVYRRRGRGCWRGSAATRTDRRDGDLAALVRSAARPGLKARLLAYREAQRAARQ